MSVLPHSHSGIMDVKRRRFVVLLVAAASAVAVAGLRAFRAEHGRQWSARLDARRNVVTLLHGGAIPFLPGPARHTLVLAPVT